ncbi:MAG: recombinase family protein [Sulfurimonadaceae bacterium]
MKIGYARVSSYGQSYDIQLDSLRAAGCEKIFSEKVSGAKEDRKEFTAMLDFAREGDQIVVTRLDRLSRSLFELQKTSKMLEEKKIDLEIIEQQIDTSTPTGRLLFNIVGTVAEFEREMIHQRAQEGRKKAVERGVVFGAKMKLSKKDVESMANLIAMGTPKTEITEIYSIGRTSVFRYLKENGYNPDGTIKLDDPQG